VSIYKFRPERSIQWSRVGPPQNLLLSASIIDAGKKFAKPIDKIAFRNQDKYWKSGVKLPLNHLKLARDFTSLLLRGFGTIAN
jgi:hypothetical protein